ncbi:MAG: hypothetical protein H6659_11625 [Ardenticatenaceae bacterium]|nr:hypothetical protein [Ardenticatenaceae bacterium]MCB8988815.1 hypothetical protein [Ardenticatenaceae bacterium]
MTLAEVHGKTPSKNSEDLLTADVFTAFRYLPATQGIYAFLRTVPELEDKLPEPLENEEVTATLHFWPLGQERKREPDLLLALQIGLRSFYVVVEAKYRSGASDKAEREEITTDGNSRKLGNQLADELRDLHHGKYKVFDQGRRKRHLTLENDKEDRFVLYLTSHAIKPQDEINRAAKQYPLAKQKLFWTNWYAVYDYFMERQSKDWPFPYREIVSDAILLLRKKSFSTFQGFDNLKLARADLVGIKGGFWQDAPVLATSFQGIHKPPKLFNRQEIGGSFWHESIM